MGKIIERVRHQQLKRAMNEIDERRSAEYLESSKRQKEYFAKQMQIFQEHTRMIDERLAAEKTQVAKKSMGGKLWNYLMSGKQ